MTKRITPKELPKVLTDEIIEILVGMALESPKKTFHWAEISDVLEERGELQKILDIVSQKRKDQQEQTHEQWWDSLSEEEKELERKKNQDTYINPDGFYGNMGNPEYPE